MSNKQTSKQTNTNGTTLIIIITTKTISTLSRSILFYSEG